jgi:hypothetical protein
MGYVNERLSYYVDKLLEVGKPAPVCSSEQCVLEWVIGNTQVAQSIYDSALDAELDADDMLKVEELYKHTLQSILATGLSALGVLEV